MYTEAAAELIDEFRVSLAHNAYSQKKKELSIRGFKKQNEDKNKQRGVQYGAGDFWVAITSVIADLYIW